MNGDLVGIKTEDSRVGLETIEAPVDLYCLNCGRDFIAGMRVFCTRGSYICPYCGSQLERI